MWTIFKWQSLPTSLTPQSHCQRSVFPSPWKHVARCIPLPTSKSNQPPEKPVRHSPITPHCLKKFKSIKWRQINVIWKRSPPPLAVGLQQTLFEVFSHIISLFTQNYETWTRHLINLILVWPSDIFECFPDVTIRHIWMLFNSFFKFQLVLLPFQQTKM